MDGDNRRATGDIRFYVEQLRFEKGHHIDEPAIALLEHLEKHGDEEERYMLKMHLLHIVEEFAAFAYERTGAE